MNQSVPTPTPAQTIGALASEAHKMGTIFPLLSRASGASYNSDPFQNLDHVGLRLFLNLTDVTGGATVTFKVQNQDPATDAWVDVPEAVTTALAAVANTTLTLYPGIEEDANVCISNPLGKLWRVVATVAVAAAVFSVGGDYLD